MLGLSDVVVKDLDMITVSGMSGMSDPEAMLTLPAVADHSTPRQIFRAIHTSYLSHLCNPFHSIAPNMLPGGQANHAPVAPAEANMPPSRRPIQGSAMFERRMEKIVGWRPPVDPGQQQPPPPPKDSNVAPPLPVKS